MLMVVGKTLEQELAGRPQQAGRFISIQDPILFFDASGAALIIYPAVIGAWIYVAAIGLAKDMRFNPSVMWPPLAAFAVFFSIGLIVLHQQEKQLKRLNRSSAKLERGTPDPITPLRNKIM